MLKILEEEIKNISLRRKHTREKVDELIKQRKIRQNIGIYNGELEWNISYYGGQVDELAWVIDRLERVKEKMKNSSNV